MPQLATHVHIAQPCQQSWAAMTPTSTGRHCAACQTTVVDFTQKTDGEILAYLAHASHACGRFRADQLGRPLLLPAAPSRWRSWLASVLALGGVLGSGRAAAQAGGIFHPGPVPATMQPAATPTPSEIRPVVPPAPAAPAGGSGPLVVRGQVVDSRGEGLPGTTVLLHGTALGTSTNMDGRFELTLPATAATGMLLFSNVGFTNEHLPVAVATAAPVVVQLAEDVTVLGGEVVVVGGYNARRPWPWHPRRLYQWSKYQLLRPFRR